MRLSRALWEKRPQYQERHDKVILEHENARPMQSCTPNNKMVQLHKKKGGAEKIENHQ